MDMEKNRPALLFLLKAMLIWPAAAVILLILCTAIISGFNISASSVAYFSSGISFLSAMSASIAVSAGQTGRKLKYALLTGLVLTVMLLMLGFIVEGRDLSADGVLSVISFTMAGTVVGGVLAPSSKSGKTKKMSKSKRWKP